MNYREGMKRERALVALIAAMVIVNAYLYFLSRDQTFVHIDAIAHVNKARGLFDSLRPGLRNLGTVWLPLPHLLSAPLAAFDSLWTSGAAGSIVSVISFIGTSLFLFGTGYEWTGSRIAGWLAFTLFALNPHLIYLFTTPENEPLMILCATGLMYYLVRWTQDQSWKHFALAALFVFAGTWTRYEGWALAAVAVVLVPIVAREQRIVSAILFAGASVTGPMLWMLFNMIYFDDPIMFIYGAGSAQAYAAAAPGTTTGKWVDSALTYFIDVAYCVNPGVLWLAIAGAVASLILLKPHFWRSTVLLLSGCGAVFGWYVLNLYLNMVPIALPGMLQNDPEKVSNVRYGSVMAATVPLFAAFFIFVVWRQVERRRAIALLMLSPLVLPDPVPAASREPMGEQFTRNLFYTEAIHNQSFWMPPFINTSDKLKEDIDRSNDHTSLILTNTRIVHVVVWATGIPMRRFVTEMYDEDWGYNLSSIRPEVRWVITEEGDQLWHARGKWLHENWTEVASGKTETTGTVHLYRRPEP